MHTIQPIDSGQQQRVIAETQRWVARGSTLFELELPPLDIQFDLRGRCAGMFVVKNQSYTIRYNRFLFAKYFKQNLHDTVPHEVAHFVTYVQFGRRGIRPHGHQWQQVMQAFGRAAEVTCDFDPHGIPMRRVKRYTYACACREHTLTSYRHLRIQRNQARYHCRACGTRLAAR